LQGGHEAAAAPAYSNLRSPLEEEADVAHPIVQDPVELRGATLGYGARAVLSGVDLTVRRGELVGVIGSSGAGKSTLLMALNATTRILSGSVRVLGTQVGGISPLAMKRLRARVGVIFQGYNLVPRLSVLDNVASGMLARTSVAAALVKLYSRAQYEELHEYLKVVGLQDEALSRCDRLSGGQKQRVAIARALAQRPELLLADEPVASLDPASAEQVMETLRAASVRYGITVIANLHQLEYANAYCSRIVGIRSGGIVHDGPPATLCDAAIRDIYRAPARASHAFTPVAAAAVAT
jgi:phosphonate transport system ATP-binding protein